MVVEKSFPRGGTVKPAEEKSEITFGAQQTKRKATQNLTKKQREKKKKLFNEDQIEDCVEAFSAELLSHKTIQEGMLVMGCVASIDGTFLKIALPGRITGKVLASQISESYTKVMNQYVDSHETVQDFHPLIELFRVGQTVYAKIAGIAVNDQSGKSEIFLTMKPSEMHSELQHNYVRNGMLLNAAIAEIQDHGYVLETGVKNLRAFTPSEKSERGLYVGQHITVKIEKLKPTNSETTAVCKQITGEDRKIKDLNDLKLEYIVPSTVLNFRATKILKDGLQGTIMNGKFTAYVNEHQLNEPLQVPEDFDVNKTYPARLLYVMPLTKLCYLSLSIKEHTQDQAAFRRGDIIENAVVFHIGTGGVVLNLDGKAKGLISFKSIRINCEGNYDQDDLITKYRKNSRHIVRIKTFSRMDSLFVCTDDPNILKQKYYCLSDLEPGEIVTATISDKHVNGGYNVIIGNVQGLIETMFLASSSENLQANSRLKCRVVSVNTHRNKVYLTNRSEYMSKDAKLLLNLSEAKVNKAFLGTVVRCYEKYFLVKFFNNIKGIFYRNAITGILMNELSTFTEGQTTCFKIADKSAEKLLLALPDHLYQLGELINVKVTNIINEGLEVSTENESNLKGLVPVRLLSDFPELAALKLSTFEVGQELQVACFTKNIFSTRDLDYFKSNPIMDWSEIRSGNILRGYIKNVTDEVVELLLPVRNLDKHIKVHMKMFFNSCDVNHDISVAPDQVINLKVLGKESITKGFTLSAKLTDVWDGNFNTTAELFAKYLYEINSIRKSLKKQGKTIAQLKLGDKISGKIEFYYAQTADASVLLGNGVSAIIKSHITEKGSKPTVGQTINCVIIWIDYLNDIVYVSHRNDDLQRISSERNLPEKYAANSGVMAKVLIRTTDAIVCSIKKGTNPLILIPTRLHFNDFGYASAAGVKEGEFCRLAFIHKEKPIAVFEKVWKMWREIRTAKRRGAEDRFILDRAKVKKAKNLSEKPNPVAKMSFAPAYSKPSLWETNSTPSGEEAGHDNHLFFIAKGTDEHQKQKITIKQEELKKTRKEGAKQHQPQIKNRKTSPEKHSLKARVTRNSGNDDHGSKFDTKTSVNASQLLKEQKLGKQHPTIQKFETLLPGPFDFWCTDSPSFNETSSVGGESSDEEDVTESVETEKKKKVFTTGEKIRFERSEEERLRKIEAEYADPDIKPQTSDQFDRLVLANPNNSITWINYMVFHLQATEIGRARAVARKALNSIAFREEEELGNIWIALLNLELRYGKKESFNDTLQEALLCNDQYKIYSKCLEMLAKSKKIPELTDMIQTVVRKFKERPEIWKLAAQSYFEVGSPEKAKILLHKALSSLAERDHISTIIAFANLHFKNHDKETSHALFEQIVTSYPKRVDVWSQYVDVLIKGNDIESARQTLDRASSQKIPIKKMRAIFKKYLNFEEHFGDAENVLNVKEMATNYVRKELGE